MTRRERRRECRLGGEGWFRLTRDLWCKPGERRGKPRFLADANVPVASAAWLRGKGFEVRTAKQLGADGFADPEIRALATRTGRMLLTRDADFWQTRGNPKLRSCGVVLLTTDKMESIGVSAAAVFLKSFGSIWNGACLKASEGRFYLRVRSYSGGVAAYEIRVFAWELFARELAPGERT